MNNKGFSLVELIMVMFLVLMLAGTFGVMMGKSAESYSSVTNRLISLDDVQLAMLRLQRDVTSMTALLNNSTTSSLSLTHPAFPAGETFCLQNGALVIGGNTCAAGSPVLLRNVQSLNFAYYDASGNVTADLAAARRIRITVQITSANAGVVSLSSDVFPRVFLYGNFNFL